MALARERRRVSIDRTFWFWSGFGAVATFLTGALYAAVIHGMGGWDAGLPWEAHLLVRLHTPLPQPVDAIVVAIPWLGTNITILPAVVIASRMLWTRGRRDLVAAIVAAAAGNYVVAFALKYIVSRPRPDLFPHRGEYTGPSYPSGHAMMATSVLFFFAYLLRRERNWTWPYYACVALGIVTIYSRMYLGVHWPTDVLAGVVMGTVWLASMLAAMDAQGDELPYFDRRARRRLTRGRRLVPADNAGPGKGL